MVLYQQTSQSHLSLPLPLERCADREKFSSLTEEYITAGDWNTTPTYVVLGSDPSPQHWMETSCAPRRGKILWPVLKVENLVRILIASKFESFSRVFELIGYEIFQVFCCCVVVVVVIVFYFCCCCFLYLENLVLTGLTKFGLCSRQKSG